MKIYLLSISRHGYGVLNVRAFNANLVVVTNTVNDFEQFRKGVELTGLQQFDSDGEALEEAMSVMEGVTSDRLRSFLRHTFQDSKEKFILGVPNSKLGASISEATEISCKSNEFVLELLRGVRLHLDNFIKSFKLGDSGLPRSLEVDLNDKGLEVPHEETKFEVGQILELQERSAVRRTEYEVGQILELAERSSVRISVAYENAGSGTILLKEGEDCLILTCGHIVKPAIRKDREIEEIFSNGRHSFAFKPISLLSQCHNEFGLLFGRDKNLLKLDVDNICTFSELEEPFEEVFSSSYAYGGVDPIPVGGRVSQYFLKNTDEDPGLIAYDLALAKSSSGAAILNRRGDIVAVHVKGMEALVFNEQG